MNPLSLLYIGGIIALLFFGSSVYQGLDGWFKTILNGPEYCFRDITQTDISLASQGASVSYTKMEGNELCFRTKDQSIVERLNQQIEDRKLKVELARIEASGKFWNETFPIIFLIGSFALVIIFMILLFTRERRYY